MYIKKKINNTYKILYIILVTNYQIKKLYIYILYKLVIFILYTTHK